MNYEIVTLSKYTAPEIIEKRNKEWISYGDDNNYFQYLINRYTGSATNNAIINGVANQNLRKRYKCLRCFNKARAIRSNDITF